MIKNFRIPIKILFQFFNVDNDLYEIPIKIERNVSIKSSSGSYSKIYFLIKKSGNIFNYEFENNIKIKCDENHIIRSNEKFILIKDCKSIDTIYGNKKLINKLYVKFDDVYDISINFPHEYITSSGIICHNTSLAKLLTNHINCDVLYVNASDERGIDDVRIKLKSFAVGAGFRPLKVAILDEADRLTSDAQGALRNMMETYSIHTRFILTCNHVEKMAPPIVSRCQTFEIKPISKTDVAKKLVYILQNEKVSFTKEDIKFIIETYYPDIRKVINFAQQSNIDGSLKIYKDNVVDLDFHKKIVEILKGPSNPVVSLIEIRQLIVDHADPDSLEPAYRYLMDNIDEYAKGKEAIVILRLAEGLKDSSSLIAEVRDIPFLACVYNILNDLKE